MFERFTDRARRTVVLAQEEARQLQHNYIGTEHILLGLLHEGEGLAGRALASLGITQADVFEDVERIIGKGKKAPSGHIPFTPRAKKCLELALREALALGDNHIGTEHILLGLLREGQGVAAQILVTRGGELSRVRQRVIEFVGSSADAVPSRGPRWLRRPPTGRSASGEGGVPVALAPEESGSELRTTPAADLSLEQAARLAGAGPVGSHHLLLAALADADSAAARTLAGLGIDLDRAREALRNANVTGSSDELPEEAGRRQMTIRVTDDLLRLEAADPVIVKLAHRVLAAVAEMAKAGAGGEPGKADASEGEDAGPDSPPAAREPGVIRGGDQISASLGTVWRALHDSLEDIHRRMTAAAESDDGGEPAGQGKAARLPDDGAKGEPDSPAGRPESAG